MDFHFYYACGMSLCVLPQPHFLAWIICSYLHCSDIPMAQFIINMNASMPASQKFIIHVLDSTHLFVQPHVAEMIRSAISEFREQNSYEKPAWLRCQYRSGVCFSLPPKNWGAANISSILTSHLVMTPLPSIRYLNCSFSIILCFLNDLRSLLIFIKGKSYKQTAKARISISLFKDCFWDSKFHKVMLSKICNENLKILNKF